jgi:argininosuccinate lyase
VNIKLNEAATKDAATHGFLNATELADHLVKKGVSFRTAHDLVGKIVLYASETNRELHDLELDDLHRFSTDIGKDVFDALSLERTLASKDRTGGTAPERVAEALAAAKRSLADDTNY